MTFDLTPDEASALKTAAIELLQDDAEFLQAFPEVKDETPVLFQIRKERMENLTTAIRKLAPA